MKISANISSCFSPTPPGQFKRTVYTAKSKWPSNGYAKKHKVQVEAALRCCAVRRRVGWRKTGLVGWGHALQGSAVPSRVVRCRVVRCGAVPCLASQGGGVARAELFLARPLSIVGPRCGVVPYGFAHGGTARRRAARCGAAQCGTAQCGTAQCGAVLCYAVRRRPGWRGVAWCGVG